MVIFQNDGLKHLYIASVIKCSIIRQFYIHAVLLIKSIMVFSILNTITLKLLVSLSNHDFKYYFY